MPLIIVVVSLLAIRRGKIATITCFAEDRPWHREDNCQYHWYATKVARRQQYQLLARNRAPACMIRNCTTYLLCCWRPITKRILICSGLRVLRVHLNQHPTAFYINLIVNKKINAHWLSGSVLFSLVSHLRPIAVTVLSHLNPRPIYLTLSKLLLALLRILS